MMTLSPVLGRSNALAACALAISGCSDDTASTKPEVGTVSRTPTQHADNDRAEVTTVEVDTAGFGDEAMIPTLLDYLQARQQSMREHAATADLVATSTYQWLQQQRVAIATAQQRGWSVPATAKITVESVREGSIDAVVQLCLWGQSVDFVNSETGRPVRGSPAQWYPFDVKMVQTTDRWLVAGVAGGDFRCEQDTP